MKLLDSRQTMDALPFDRLVDAISEMFARGCEMPVRHHHNVPVKCEADATLLLMPAWRSGDYIGVKIATVFPGNADRGLPAVNASYLLLSARNGQMLAMIDGGELTARRTATASALAARFLAREDAEHLLVVGTGRLCGNLVQAHAAIRPISKVSIWGRNPEKADQAAKDLSKLDLSVGAVGDLESAAREADIISCATLSVDPLIRGDWLRPGTHVDLVGAFKPNMRETDDAVMRRSLVYVDTYDGALREGGDLVQAIAAGALQAEDIRGDLAELCRSQRKGRQSADEITVFKSTGAASEDLAAAILAYESMG